MFLGHVVLETLSLLMIKEYNMAYAMEVPYRKEMELDCLLFFSNCRINDR
jgi:hypothetical protein